VAFLPSIAAIPFLLQLTGEGGSGLWVLAGLAAVFCLVSGFGVMRVVEKRALRIVLSLLLAVGFFVLNALIVFFMGCVSALGK
jgi:hypothetical protein